MKLKPHRRIEMEHEPTRGNKVSPALVVARVVEARYSHSILLKHLRGAQTAYVHAPLFAESGFVLLV
jgi:hypothetical protein